MQCKVRPEMSQIVALRGILLSVMLVMCFPGARSAHATDRTWTGGGPTDRFLSSTNWSPAGIPGSSDRAIFNLPGGDEVSFWTPNPSYPTITNQQLEVVRGEFVFNFYDGYGGQTYALDPPIGIPDTIAAIVGSTAGPQAALSFYGKDDEIVADGALWIGRDSGSNGKVDIGRNISHGSANWTSVWPVIVGVSGNAELEINYGTVTNTLGVVGSNASSTASAIVNHNGNWVNTGNLIVGSQGDGQLEIHGDVSNSAYAAIAKSGGSNSGVLVDGGTWNCNDALYVGGHTFGAAGTGQLAVEGNGVVNVDMDMTVWSTGTVTVHGGSVSVKNLWNHGDITIDGDCALVVLPGGDMTVSPTGSVDINQGALSVPGDLTVDAGGRLNLAGGELTTSMDTFIAAPGAFNWTSGTLSCRWSDVIIDSGEPLGATLSMGAEKTLNFVGVMAVGTTNAGTLTVNGSQVESISGQVGNVGPTTASVVLQGPGSSWSMTQHLIVRSGNTADVTVEQGAFLTNQNAIVASLAGTTANIDVKDPESMWHATGSVYLGGDAGTPGGAGTLDVTNHAAMNVDADMAVWDAFAVTVADSTLDVAGSLTSQGSFTTTGASCIQAGEASIASIPGATASIALSGEGSQFASEGDVHLGGRLTGPGGSGTLNLTAHTSMNVGGCMTVWDDFDVTVTDSFVSASTLLVSGSMTVTGDSFVQVVGGMLGVGGPGASLSVAPPGELFVPGTQVRVSMGGAMDAILNGDGGT